MLAPRGNGGIADGHAVQAGSGGRRASRARGWLTLFGPHSRAMGICGGSIVNCPGSAAGYNFAARLLPPVPGLARGKRALEALRVPRHGKGLRSFLRLDDMPGSGAGGDWLRRGNCNPDKHCRERLTYRQPVEAANA